MPVTVNGRTWTLDPRADGKLYSVDDDPWPIQSPTLLPAVRNRAGFATATRHAYTSTSTPTIHHVTSLDPSNPNSLPGLGNLTDAIVVFDVAGYVPLTGDLNRQWNNVWIAGQTAPAPGITLGNWGLFLDNSNNVLMQHIRVQVGRANHTIPDTNADGWNFAATVGNENDNIVFHHCEIMFGWDEMVEADRGLIRSDFIECVIAYSLDDAAALGEGGRAMLINTANNETSPGSHKLSVQGSLLAHCAERNPKSSMAHLLFANNLIYNYGTGSRFSQPGDKYGPQFVNLVGNRYKTGASTTASQPAWLDGASNQQFGGTVPGVDPYDGSQAYASDNSRNGTIPVEQWGSGNILRNDTEWSLAQVQANALIASATPDGYVPWTNGTDMENYIVGNVGAFPKTSRNTACTAAVSSYTNGTGVIISDEATIGSDSGVSQVNNPFVEVGSPHAAHPIESGRTNIEVQLLDLGESV